MNAAVVYAVQQNAEETFAYLKSEERDSLHSDHILVALSSVAQLLGLTSGDVQRLLGLELKGPSYRAAGMSLTEFVAAVRCCALLHGHLALQALPALRGKLRSNGRAVQCSDMLLSRLERDSSAGSSMTGLQHNTRPIFPNCCCPKTAVPDLSGALFHTYLAYSTGARHHGGAGCGGAGASCACRLLPGEPHPRMYRDSFIRLCRDAGFEQPHGACYEPHVWPHPGWGLELASASGLPGGPDA